MAIGSPDRLDALRVNGLGLRVSQTSGRNWFYGALTLPVASGTRVSRASLAASYGQTARLLSLLVINDKGEYVLGAEDNYLRGRDTRGLELFLAQATRSTPVDVEGQALALAAEVGFSADDGVVIFHKFSVTYDGI